MHQLQEKKKRARYNFEPTTGVDKPILIAALLLFDLPYVVQEKDASRESVKEDAARFASSSSAAEPARWFFRYVARGDSGITCSLFRTQG